jgi:hypothetical protein
MDKSPWRGGGEAGGVGRGLAAAENLGAATPWDSGYPRDQGSTQRSTLTTGRWSEPLLLTHTDRWADRGSASTVSSADRA